MSNDIDEPFKVISEMNDANEEDIENTFIEGYLLGHFDGRTKQGYKPRVAYRSSKTKHRIDNEHNSK